MFAIRLEALKKLMDDPEFVEKLEKCKTHKEVLNLVIEFAEKHSLRLDRFRWYDWYYWCTICHKWIPKDSVVYAKNGTPLCPYCHKAVRQRSRNT